MSERERPGSVPGTQAGHLPQYVTGSGRGTLLARFAPGSEIRVDQGRTRSYPGIKTEAASMNAYYDAFAELVGEGQVLDAGSGAGSGALRLGQRGLQVTAVDSDPLAVAFAQKYAPSARHIEASLSDFTSSFAFDGAIVADTLGQTLDPEAALIAVARSLKLGAPLLIAESAAHVSQCLRAPQRRGFSLERLRALLVRTGFSVQAVISNHLPFVSILASLTHPNVLKAFAAAYSFATLGDLKSALRALDGAEEAGPEVELEVLMARLELHLAIGEGDAAAHCCFRARELAPDDARPLIGLGRIALAGGATAEALSFALDALERDPTEAAACTLAALCADTLNHPDAIMTWRTASDLAPDDLILAREFASAASRLGDHALALHVLGRVEGYGSPEPAYHLTRAWLLLAASRKDEARIEARIAQARSADPVELSELLKAIQQAA